MKPPIQQPISAVSFIAWLLLDVLIGVVLAIGWMFFAPYFSSVYQMLQRLIEQWILVD